MNQRATLGNREGDLLDRRQQHADDLVNRLTANQGVRTRMQGGIAVRLSDAIGKFARTRDKASVGERLGDRLGAFTLLNDDLDFGTLFRHRSRRASTRERDKATDNSYSRYCENDDGDNRRDRTALRANSARVIRAKHLVALGMG